MLWKQHLWKISHSRSVFELSASAHQQSFTDLQAIRTNLQEALKVVAGNGSEEEKVQARIEADVYEALQHAVASK